MVERPRVACLTMTQTTNGESHGEMRGLVVKVLFSAAAIVFCFAAGMRIGAPPSQPNVITGVPPFIFVRFDAGTERRLPLRDRSAPLLLLQWSAECPVCATNLERWESLVAEVQALDADVEIRLLSFNAVATTRRMLESSSLGGHAEPCWSDRGEIRAWGTSAVPATLVIPARSATAYLWVGVLHKSQVSRMIAIFGGQMVRAERSG